MKRIRLGIVLFGLLGVTLLGTSGSDAATAIARHAEEVAPAATVVTAPAHAPAAIPARPAEIAAKLNLSLFVPANEAPAPTPDQALRAPWVLSASSPCGEGMLEVEGDYCTSVEQECLRWLDPDTKMRCAEFAPTSACLGRTIHKHFCIDRFEYPNAVGMRPVVMKTWYEARDACRGAGKRLCGDTEWTLACEGRERLPYPYGYGRDATACNIDKPHPEPNVAAIQDPKTRDAEVARLDQRDPSGDRDGCTSPFGVQDMTGNVDEWVVNETGHPFTSGLKGGYWGPVRTRCRPMTTAHSETFSFYQIGFRCCADAGSRKLASNERPIPTGI